MGRKIDLTGQRFGRLVAVREVEPSVSASGRIQRRYECKCDCGNTVVVMSWHLPNGHTKSCGCLKAEVDKNHATHGKSNTRLYHIWSRMKQRCKVRPEYARVSVCKEWQRFETFYEWSMSHGYADDLSIDRIDNNGNYEPSNCRWATDIEQANNMTTNRRETLHGVTCTIAQWARIFGIPHYTLRHRLDRGWELERALTTPIPDKFRKHKEAEAKGYEQLSLFD